MKAWYRWQTSTEWEVRRALGLAVLWSRGGWNPKGDWEEAATNVEEKSDKGDVREAKGREIL